MRNIRVEYHGDDHNFQGASLLAKEAAKQNQMRDPTIMAWHENSVEGMAPYFDGADPATWWEKYGIGNGGNLEVSVGDHYRFIMMDARAYEQLGDIPLRNLADAEHNQYLCYPPKQDKLSEKTSLEGCTQLEGWAAHQF